MLYPWSLHTRTYDTIYDSIYFYRWVNDTFLTIFMFIFFMKMSCSSWLGYFGVSGMIMTDQEPPFTSACARSDRVRWSQAFAHYSDHVAFLIIPVQDWKGGGGNDHPPYPPADPLEGEWWANQGVGACGESPGGAEGAGISSTEVLAAGRHGVPAQSLKLSKTGFARSLADKRRLSQWSTDIAWPGGHCEGH